VDGAKRNGAPNCARSLAAETPGPHIAWAAVLAAILFAGVVMSEPKVVASYPNRRLQKRFSTPADAEASLKFRHPAPNGQQFDARLRDISLSGLSLILPSEIPGIQTGDILRGMEVRVARKTFRGDLLVMHVTPANEPGAICGGLFYPDGDEDLITIRLVVRALDAASQAR
jgi:hypothetical protein